MVLETTKASEIPRINFSGLSPAERGGAWAAVRATLLEALEGFGTFKAEYDRLSASVREEFFVKAAKELFSIPQETKSNDAGRIALVAASDDDDYKYESHLMDDSDTVDGVDRFTGIFWPNGHPLFRDAMLPFTKGMAELQEMIMRMVFEGYGMSEENQNSILGSSTCALRVSRYLGGEGGGLPAHTDFNFLNIICQHAVAGLDVELRDGRWVSPPLGACVVVMGDMMEMVTNGRVKPTPHEVRFSEATEEEKGRKKKMRYSAFMGPKMASDATVETPAEMVDEEHPLLFNPIKWGEYLEFKYYSGGAAAAGDYVRRGLKEFCGVGSTDVQA